MLGRAKSEREKRREGDERKQTEERKAERGKKGDATEGGGANNISRPRHGMQQAAGVLEW